MKLNAIKEMENYARYQEGVVSLSQGIPYLRSDDAVREGVSAAMRAGKVDMYSDPQGVLELREALSDRLANEGMRYSPQEIVVTAGAIEAFVVTMFSLITPSRNEVIIPTPAYAAYFKAVELAHGTTVPLLLDEEQDWQIDLTELEKTITPRTAAILICNPNNPTGSLYSREALESICDLAQQQGVTVILDEVYRNIIFDGHEVYVPCRDETYRPDIIRIVSFSKDFSLTGWRVGFLHADQSRIERMVAVHDTLINCAPVISQYAALAALQHQDRIFGENQKIYARHRAIMKSYLDLVPDTFAYTMPEGSYFFFPRFVQPRDSVAFCRDLLHAEKVAVVPGSAFGEGGENHIRICFGKDEASIRKGMEGLVRFASQAERLVVDEARDYSASPLA